MMKEITSQEKTNKNSKGAGEKKKIIEVNSKTATILPKARENKLQELNEEQKNVCQLALSGQNVCFLGEAGTGKSFLLKHLIKLLSAEYGEELFITSYTG